MSEIISPTTPGKGIIAPFDGGADAVRGLGADGNVTLWYLGEQAERFAALPGLSDPGTVIGDVGVHLDGLADELEPTLLAMDEGLLGPKADRLAWDVSLLSDLSPYVGDVQVNLARFLHVRDCLQEGGQHVFLVDESRFGDVLAATGRKNGLDLIWAGDPTTAPSVWVRFRARLSALKTAISRKWALARLRGSAPAPWDRLKTCDVLVFDWAEPDTYQSGVPIGWTRNLRRVPRILQAGGHTVGFVFSPIDWKHSFPGIAKNVCAADAPAVFVDECRSLMDVWRGIWASLRLGRDLTGTVVCKGLDLTPLALLARERDDVSAQASLAYGYGVMARILRDRGIRPKAIIHPYENQGWERALRYGFRKWQPQTRIIAYQFAPFADRYLSFYPFASEVQSEQLPDRLICMADHFTRQFRQRGFPTERIAVGGTVMFEDMLKSAKPASPLMPSCQGKAVLCATSIKYSEALNIVEKVVSAAQEVGGVRVIVNFHPTVDAAFKEGLKAFIKVRYSTFLDSVEFTDAETRTLIDSANGVFYNTSGSAFDALLRNVPVFYVPVDGNVTQNKVPDSLSMGVTSHDAICGALRALISGEGMGSTPDKKNEFSDFLLDVNERVFLDAIND